jgi:hypothetical protein
VQASAREDILIAGLVDLLQRDDVAVQRGERSG